jgi:hypothetical protein
METCVIVDVKLQTFLTSAQMQAICQFRAEAAWEDNIKIGHKLEGCECTFRFV